MNNRKKQKVEEARMRASFMFGQRSNEPRHVYFGYGANTNMAHMARRCPDAIPIGAALLSGFRLEFHGVADVAPVHKKKAHRRAVRGALWRISDQDLAALDVFEGYPRMYRREWLPVQMHGRTIKAIVYRMNHPGDRYPPLIQYEQTLREGYDDFCIPHDQIDAAIERARSRLSRRGVQRSLWTPRDSAPRWKFDRQSTVAATVEDYDDAADVRIDYIRVGDDEYRLDGDLFVKVERGE